MADFSHLIPPADCEWCRWGKLCSKHAVPEQSQDDQSLVTTDKEETSAMQIHVGLITWGPDHGDEEEFITASTTIEQVRLALAERLIYVRKEAPSIFGYFTGRLGTAATEGGNDDLDEFYSDEVIVDIHAKGVDIDTAEAYLDAFREATTAPWWSIQEVELNA